MFTDNLQMLEDIRLETEEIEKVDKKKGETYSN